MTEQFHPDVFVTDSFAEFRRAASGDRYKAAVLSRCHYNSSEYGNFLSIQRAIREHWDKYTREGDNPQQVLFDEQIVCPPDLGNIHGDILDKPFLGEEIKTILEIFANASGSRRIKFRTSPSNDNIFSLTTLRPNTPIMVSSWLSDETYVLDPQSQRPFYLKEGDWAFIQPDLQINIDTLNNSNPHARRLNVVLVPEG